MLTIKDNLSPQNNHLVFSKLTVNNQYKFESVVLPKCFTDTKLTCTPLIMGSVDTNKSTVSARFLCILSIKRIFKGTRTYNELKAYLYVH